MMLKHRVSRYVTTIDFREVWKALAAIFKGQQYWRSSPNSELFCWSEVGVTLRQGADRFNPLQPEYHLPFYIELKTFDHRATLTALERNLGLRKVTTHSGGWTLKSTQETTRGDQEVFSYQQLRQRSKTATFQEHLMQFRPCAQMTLGETQLDLLLRGENWDQPAKWITRISLRPRTHRTAVCKRKAPLSALLLPQPGNLD